MLDRKVTVFFVCLCFFSQTRQPLEKVGYLVCSLAQNEIRYIIQHQSVNISLQFSITPVGDTDDDWSEDAQVGATLHANGASLHANGPYYFR